MEKNAESGDPSVLAQNSLPEIHGVDVGAVEITDNEEEHSDTDDEMQEEDENDDGADRERKVARKSKNDIDKDDPDFLLKKKERIDEVKKLKIFPCYLCKYNAGDIEEMHKHALEEHPKEIIKCEPCSQIFYIRKHYKVHCAGSVHQKNLLRSNVKLEVLTCRFCQKKFMDESSHDLHVEYIHMHNSSEEQISRLCQGRDLVTQLYGDHLKQLAKAPFNARVSCPECGRFCAKNGLIEHLRTHTGERPFKCRHCNKTFISTLALRRHILDHIGVPIMKCQECGKTFKKNHLYHRHILIHENMKNGVKYPCDKCDSSFYHIDGLKAHAKRHRERQFKCPVQGCKWSFVGKPDLTEHMYTHTREKKYLCDICGYEGGTRTRIRRHYKTHEPGKMFTCEYCPYKGASKSHLQRHVRIHTGSKPYKCLYCSYECNVGVNMRKHILQTRKHQGMHLYPCRFCDYKSNVADEFKQHLVQLHSDYYRRRASVPLMLFTGLYRPEKDIQKPPEGSEIHQVMKGRFVKIYDGTRVGALEAAGPVKKKPKPPRTVTQNSVDDLSASHSQPHQQHSSGLHSTSILRSHLSGGLQSHQPPLNGLQSRETPKSEDEMDKPDISLPCTSSEVTSVSVSQQQQHLQTSASAGTLDMVYPRGLPWTVVTPSSRAESWMPGAQMVDMVMPQPCRIQDLQVVGGNQTSVPTPFISNSGINFLTTINMEGATYTPLEAGVYQVITPATSDAITSVNVVHQ
ncbi:zinc finger protein 407-like [Littorina saxatilis]|uniref:C2H2-type domain-containing protein n=1 Tax=Littorina saxatilis TaxID=31220 RepID=A0AAN9C0A4_9CAEN